MPEQHKDSVWPVLQHFVSTGHFVDFRCKLICVEGNCNLHNSVAQLALVARFEIVLGTMTEKCGSKLRGPVSKGC